MICNFLCTNVYRISWATISIHAKNLAVDDSSLCTLNSVWMQYVYNDNFWFNMYKLIPLEMVFFFLALFPSRSPSDTLVSHSIFINIDWKVWFIHINSLSPSLFFFSEMNFKTLQMEMNILCYALWTILCDRIVLLISYSCFSTIKVTNEVRMKYSVHVILGEVIQHAKYCALQWWSF